MKACCFRFDVDTHACVIRGVPALLEVARKHNVAFTFFVNMGRAFDRGITLRKLCRRLIGIERTQYISAASKLGLRDSLVAALFNPKAGPSAPNVLRKAASEHHEIALHGGRNHAQWERSAHTWTEDRLRKELATGIQTFRELGITDPVSFASPAWNSPRALDRLLASLGFKHLADEYSPSADGPSVTKEKLTLVPTNITPGSGRSGFIETARGQDLSDQALLDNFRKQLLTKQRLAIVYDHPFYAGIHAIPVVSAMIETAQRCGFRICTIEQAMQNIDPSI